MQTPLSPLAGCGPVGEGTSGKVLNGTVRSLNHASTTIHWESNQRFLAFQPDISSLIKLSVPLNSLFILYTNCIFVLILSIFSGFFLAIGRVYTLQLKGQRHFRTTLSRL